MTSEYRQAVAEALKRQPKLIEPVLEKMQNYLEKKGETYYVFQTTKEKVEYIKNSIDAYGEKYPGMLTVILNTILQK